MVEPVNEGLISAVISSVMVLPAIKESIVQIPPLYKPSLGLSLINSKSFTKESTIAKLCAVAGPVLVNVMV